jgi:hypothetical protein
MLFDTVQGSSHLAQSRFVKRANFDCTCTSMALSGKADRTSKAPSRSKISRWLARTSVSASLDDWPPSRHVTGTGHICYPFRSSKPQQAWSAIRSSMRAEARSLRHPGCRDRPSCSKDWGTRACGGLPLGLPGQSYMLEVVTEALSAGLHAREVLHCALLSHVFVVLPDRCRKHPRNRLCLRV